MIWKNYNLLKICITTSYRSYQLNLEIYSIGEMTTKISKKGALTIVMNLVRQEIRRKQLVDDTHVRKHMLL